MLRTLKKSTTYLKSISVKTNISSMSNILSVSIIIPTLNEELYIEKCLNSVFLQSYPSSQIEIFVIDGGSLDRTKEIINRLCSSHSNLFLLENKKKIQSAAFNIGIDVFKGDILIRLDAHCFYDSKYIQYCVENHTLSDYGNVGGFCFMETGTDTNMAKVLARVSSSKFGLGGAAYRVGKVKKYTDSVPFGSFTRKTLSMVGKMNESLPRGEDNEYNSRIREAGYKILFDPRIISYYCLPLNSKLFLKKYYTNGYSIGILLRIARKSVSFRHLVPLAFLFALSIGILLSFFNTPFKYALLIFVCIYFIMNLLSAVTKFLKHEIKLIPIYIYIVFLVHLHYGIGTLLGLIKGKY